MNPLFNLASTPSFALLFLPAIALAGEGDTAKAIHALPLDDQRVYSVPVSVARVTTVSFPGPITAIDAALVTTDAKTPGLFQLAHQPGTPFFSVRSLAKDASTNVNVRWNNKTYVLELKDSVAPVLSLIFQPPADPKADKARRQQPVTPLTLLGLLDTAKAYAALKQSHPDAVRDVTYRDHRARPPVMDHGALQVHVEEVFRFDAQDTLVFRVRLRNTAAHELRHDPGGFIVRVGEHRFPASISDASGVIPAAQELTAYFAVTGAPDGGRNDLSVNNDFVIVLDTMAPPIMGPPLPSKKPALPLPEKGGNK